MPYRIKQIQEDGDLATLSYYAGTTYYGSNPVYFLEPGDIEEAKRIAEQYTVLQKEAKLWKACMKVSIVHVEDTTPKKGFRI